MLKFVKMPDLADYIYPAHSNSIYNVGSLICLQAALR